MKSFKKFLLETSSVPLDKTDRLNNNTWKNIHHSFTIAGHRTVIIFRNMGARTHEVHFETYKGKKQTGIDNESDPHVGLQTLFHVKKAINRFIQKRSPHKISLSSDLWKRNSPRHKIYATVAQKLANDNGGKYKRERKGTYHTIILPHNSLD